MLAPERHRLILLELESKGQATVVELKSLLQVSLDTVRRDLERLEQEGKLQRVHGGAVSKREEIATNQAFFKRKITLNDRKQELATYAVDLVKEYQAVSLNAGTTNIELAKRLAARFEKLTVITNSLRVADILAQKKGFTVIIPGGYLNHEEFSLYGRSIEEEIMNFNADFAFISINAISLDKGLTDFRQGEAEVINAMLKSAKRKVVVADSSKFETVSYLNICGLDQIDMIVTDSFMDKELQETYQKRNISIINANSL
ncbi:DeoR/GlpR family DNA-binding transcription regulator [Paenibacillus aceris]|uniref:DeoR/GlpR family transcriptional regulator of sugar metabolism n=1 Tax=Paenibacillus aceris TaxID=869555 RepID=A0ABS4HWY0_9BACL|nr:DeoR/GlpR family DNA-binding transcription regulator [Paenibacillus aceris]MBP1963133.1 DeoR/GlpR family transcriptional regulator of sugar metabolism [Paenibacillus aceris]NHW38748.1 DeoR/GlpR transcriptional regulator [Paenibacillus aceris]